MRTFRDTWATPILGMLALVLPAILSADAAAHLISGVPMMVANGPNVHGVHVGSRLEELNLTFVPLVASVFGFVLIIVWFTSTIKTDVRGIRKSGTLGRRGFRAEWSDLVSVSQRVGRRRDATVYVVATTHGELEIMDTEHNLKLLLREIRRWAPDIDYSSWDEC